MAETPEILDVWAHVLPQEYFARLNRLLVQSEPPLSIDGYEEWPDEFPALWDMEARWRTIEGLEGYRQILSLAVPPVEDFGDAETCLGLARLANDELAQLTVTYPDKVAGFVAAVALNDVSGSLEELERAVVELGALGVQLYTTVQGVPIDSEEFSPIFDKAAELDCGIWLHPTRYRSHPDYPSEQKSHYGLWWSIGWPYESTTAMTRLAFSGLFTRHPGLRVITHHGGGLVPHFADRIVEFGIAEAVVTTNDPRTELADQLRNFYPDTVMGSAAGLRSVIDFFGNDKILFASDMPYGPPDVVQHRLAVVAELGLDARDRAALLAGNARGLLR